MLVFYALLSFGAIWMVYPFLLMVSGSLKSEFDAQSPDIIPAYLTDAHVLFCKFMEERYGRADIATMAARIRDSRGNRVYSFESISVPPRLQPQVLRDWQAFLAEKRDVWPKCYLALGHAYGVKSISEISYRYRQALQKAFPERAPAELTPALLPEQYWSRNYYPPAGDFGKVYDGLRVTLPNRYFDPVSIEGVYLDEEVLPAYGTSEEKLKQLNTDFQSNYASVFDVSLSPTLPGNPRQRDLWIDFVRSILSPRFILFDPSLLPAYIDFLKSKYGTLASLNSIRQFHYADWHEIHFPTQNASTAELTDAADFLQTNPDFSKLRIVGPDFEWRTYLENRYRGDIAALDAAWSTHLESFGAAQMPILAYDAHLLEANRTAVTTEYLTRNYRVAWNVIATSGNGLRNTVIFCLLNVLTALIVNPLAAYALSRFQPSWGQAVMFFLMATMAFPAEVTQIPAFLLLRDLGWLNTFAALVIPAAANGYSIFLLKGFFDGLPRDLYEAAAIDGCGDLRAFFRITIPLSAPILAVIALAAFASAYGAFMFALLVCQKESMWTLMVYIYQMQQDYNSPPVFAALVIAAIPTLLVFVLCQKVIMQGIVVPVEK